MLRSIPENFRFGKNLVQEIFFSKWGSVFEIFEWSKNRKNFFCSKSLRIVQFVKINGFKRFLIFFPSHWVTRPRRFLKIKSLSIFSTLAGWICFILHIQVVLMVLDHLTTRNYLTWGHNCAKLGQFYRKKGENLDFRLFFGFECCYYVMMIILTVLTDITNLLKGIMMQSLANHV